MFDFTEKVAISTGATSTIGKEVVARFAAAGGLPVIADLYYEAAKATAKELGSERVGSSAVAMDVAGESSVNMRWPQHSRRFADPLLSIHTRGSAQPGRPGLGRDARS